MMPTTSKFNFNLHKYTSIVFALVGSLRWSVTRWNGHAMNVRRFTPFHDIRLMTWILYCVFVRRIVRWHAKSPEKKTTKQSEQRGKIQRARVLGTDGKGPLDVLQSNDYLPCGREIVVRGNI